MSFSRRFKSAFSRSFSPLRFLTLMTYFGLFGAAAWVATGCSKSKPSAQSQENLNRLRVQLRHEPVSLDPALAEDGVSFQILNNISDGLVGYDSLGNLENRLAKDFTVSSNGKRYEFELRKGIRWSDGKPVQAKDFITSFDRLVGKNSVSKLAPLFAPIERYFEKSGKLVFELKYPAPYLIHAFALPPALPVRQDILDQHQGHWPDLAPSTGDYWIQSHQLGQKYVLQRNPYGLEHFRNDGLLQDREKEQDSEKGKKIPENIEILIVGDESTALHLFEKGKIDLLMNVPLLDFSRLKAQGLIQTFPFLATYYLSFNCKKPPFDQKEWRRAVAGAIRRNEMTTVFNELGAPAWGWIPGGLEGSIAYEDPKVFYSDSVAHMKKIFEQEIKNKKFKNIQAIFDSGERNTQVMEKVQQDLMKNLSLPVTLTPLDWRSYIQKIQTDPPAIFRFAWMAPFHDPLPHLEVFKTGNRNNYSGFSNQQYDQLVSEISKMKSGKDRTEKIHLAQGILLEEAPVVPLFYYAQNTGVSLRVKNFRSSPFGTVRFRELILEK